MPHGGDTLSARSGEAPHCMNAAPNYAGKGACKNSGDKESGHSPANQAMRRVSKEHFMRMSREPALPQAARDITTRGSGEPLRHDQPNGAAYSDRLCRKTVIGPRRD